VEAQKRVGVVVAAVVETLAVHRARVARLKVVPLNLVALSSPGGVVAVEVVWPGNSELSTMLVTTRLRTAT